MNDVSIQDALTLVHGVWYIDPVRFLPFLEKRVSLIMDRIAAPGTDYPTTEALRARRAELLTLIQQLRDNTNVP